ncbi:MAG: MFS transporter [Spirochaetaceae bacterium]|nr:MFS transporter [Spirochaetaceae bacterium]MDT8297307.1 MFS transporter [Spirochaetaceae bacterium]
MKKGFQRGRIVAVSISHMFHDTYQAFLAPLLPLLVGKFGISLSTAGLLDVVRNLPSLINPFLGIAVDRVPVKFFNIITPAVSALLMSFVGIAPTYGVIVLMMFVSGINSSLFYAPGPVLVKRLAGGRTGSGMSYDMLGGEISRTLGPIIITGAVTLWTLEGTWRLFPVGVAASVVLYFVLRNYNAGEGHSTRQRDVGFPSVFRSLLPLFSFIGGYSFFLLAMKVCMTLYLPAFLMNNGKTLMSASLSLSVLQFSGAAGTLFAGSISDRIGRKSTLLISAIARALLMWFFLISGDVMATPILIAMGFFLFAPGPVVLALVQDVSSNAPAFSNGMYMRLNFLIRSLMVFVVGQLIDRTGFDLTYRITASGYLR